VKILKTTQTYLPYLRKGGPPVKVSGIAKALVARGHDVTVLTADLGDMNGHSPLKKWDREPGEWGWQKSHDGVSVIYLRSLGGYRASTINPKVLSFCSQELWNYELVHVYGLYDTIGLAAAWFCRRRRIPYVLEPLGMFGPKVRSQRKKKLYGSVLGNSLFSGAAKVIATSETEQQELVAGGIPEEKVALRRNGVDLTAFQNLPEHGKFRKRLCLSDEPLILFIGRFSFIKGLDVLVQAFAKLGTNAKLVLAGPDDNDGSVARVWELVAEHNLQNRVIVSAPLFGEEKLEALVDADVVVLPSRYESFGNAAAEAIACGRPVLVTSGCGIAPLVKDRAGLVVECDPDALSDGLRALIENKELSARLAEGCFTVARELSWDEPIALMEGIYRELTTSRAAVIL
jgi:glycosyltransferase involved in cell wall biosynthesis